MIKSGESGRLIEVNCNLVALISQLAKYIKSDSLNKFGLLMLIEALRYELINITTGLINSIIATDEKKYIIKLTLLADAQNKLMVSCFSYCCNEEGFSSFFKKSVSLKCDIRN